MSVVSNMKKIYILLGHEDKETFNGALADAYERGARAAGHDVRRTNIGDLKFDPILHKGYKEIQVLEPDLVKVQEDILWAEHLVFIYPMWWSSMPAIMKGMIDRVWLPRFAYRFKKYNLGWTKLLGGRDARVVTTMDSIPVISRILFGDSTRELVRATLKFSGISPVQITRIGPLKFLSDNHKKRIIRKLERMGRKGK
ncbi:MAG: NAD(P)H-dependent oxidoreductase [Candidatus Pacebacteria bacterium]|nr:NAD(P)H-dependent oxidoreductase [Candidatus Paceibacterota bacterium]